MASLPNIDPTLLAAFRATVRAKIERDIEREKAEAEALRGKVVPQVEEAIARARAQGLCRGAWLFGSFAWGQPGDRSDVDLLIDGDVDETASLVERACGRMLHAIELDRAPQSLRERVLTHGKPL